MVPLAVKDGRAQEGGIRTPRDRVARVLARIAPDGHEARPRRRRGATSSERVDQPATQLGEQQQRQGDQSGQEDHTQILGASRAIEKSISLEVEAE